MTPPSGMPKCVYCGSIARNHDGEECRVARLMLKLHMAISAIESARRWKDIGGLTPSVALEQVEIDLSQALQRIHALGNGEE